MNAIKYALEFFKYEKTTFYLMHAYQNEFYDHEDLKSREEFESVLEGITNQSRNNLKILLKKVKELPPNPNFNYHTISAYNVLVEECNLLSKANNIDLIVMGTRGKSDERHIVFGSQTFQVLKYVDCPVLAVPVGYNNTQPKRILFPTDFMMPYKRRELKLLSVLAKSYRSNIDVLYVSKSHRLSIRQEDNKAFIEDCLKENDLNFYQEQSRKIANSIKNHITDKSIDMIVMVNTQHSFLEDMLFPSNIDKIGLGLKIPLLAMQNKLRT